MNTIYLRGKKKAKETAMICEHDLFVVFGPVQCFNWIRRMKRMKIWKKENFFNEELKDFSCNDVEEGPWITQRSK